MVTAAKVFKTGGGGSGGWTPTLSGIIIFFIFIFNAILENPGRVQEQNVPSNINFPEYNNLERSPDIIIHTGCL